MADDAATELLALLKVERAALVKGGYESLESLAAEKEQLMRRMAEDLPDQAQVDRVRHNVEINSRLLAAAAAGFRAAIDRINNRMGPSPVLETYSADGSRSPLSCPRPRHERRA